MRSGLLIALTVIFELIGTTSLKLSDGFTRPFWSGVVLVAYAVAFYVLAQAVKIMPLGTVYAIWAGLGTAGTAVIGIIIWKEPVNPMRLVGIGLVVLGVVLLNISGEGH